ncbi:MAG: hypothetical protein AB7L90_24315 [Hyphomicrobiaceae bacterium]
MRLFAATSATGTNTFSPLPTNLDSCKQSFLRPGARADDAERMCTASSFAARRRASQDGYSLIENSCFAKRVIFVDSDAPRTRDSRTLPDTKSIARSGHSARRQGPDISSSVKLATIRE